MDCAALAGQMFAECVRDEQSARQVDADQDAEAVREHLRALAAADGVRIRTARLDGTVVVVRLDAAVWHEDAATMRSKLAPPSA